MFVHLFHSRLQIKFTILITALILVVMSIVAVIIVFREQRMIEDKVLQKGTLLINTLCAASEDPLIKADYPALRDFADETCTDKDIAYVYIFEDSTRKCVAYSEQQGNHSYEGKSYEYFTDSLSQKIFNATGLFTEKHIFKRQDVIEISKPVVTEDIQYGIIRIGLSLKNLDKELNHTTLVVVVISIFAVLIGSVFAWFLTIIILNPLKILVKSVNTVAGGDFTHRVELKTDDEFRTVADNFNKMTSNIDILYDVSNKMSFSSDTEDLLNIILDKALNALSSSHGSLMLVDESEKYMKVAVVRGFDTTTRTFLKIPIGEGIAGTVAKEEKGLIINEGYKDERFKIFGDGPSYEKNIKSLLCVPLKADKKILGVINIVNKLNKEYFSDTDLKFMEVLANQAAIALSKAKLYEESITDGLTKLFIHRYFQSKLDDEIKRANRYKTGLSLLMLDIDHFKKFNDTYGHLQGDSVLIHTANIIKDSVREIDIACRYGGEELAVIMPATDTEGAYIVAERLRKKIEEHNFPAVNNGKTLHVTVSIGIATFPVHAELKQDLIHKADQALYLAKANGRNRVNVMT